MKLYFDGGSKSNPGESSSASIIFTDTQTIYKSVYYKKATNNESEYNALIIGLETAIENGIKNIDVYGDSKLVIMQSQNLWKVKSPNLISLHLKVRSLIKEFESITFTHVLRHLNKEADSLANETVELKSDIYRVIEKTSSLLLKTQKITTKTNKDEINV